MSLECLFYQNDSVTNPLFVDEKVNDYIKRISKIKNLTAEEEQNLAKEAKNGNEKAKRELIKCNLKLVVAVAKKVIHNSKLPLSDLIQEGNMGLMIAVDKFNPKFGYRLATYASWWIKQSMFKAISEQSHSVKIPVYIQETLSKYSKIKAEMENKTNREIKSDEVAKEMNIEPFKINNYLNAYKKTLSLDSAFETSNGSEVKLSDIIEDGKSNVQSDIEYEAMKKDLNEIISTLKEREQKVILCRFGLNGREKQTLEEIGKTYGVTKECIRQTEARALNKLKNLRDVKILAESYL